ncbi:MAG TPA: tetratricopeptide repeat protein [Pyrinomonadaceae bacterium]|jgi:cytochrome c-type biogenesis protein CcmH/NrfG
MHTFSRGRRAAAAALTLLVALSALQAGCRRGAQKGGDPAAQANAGRPNAAAPSTDIAQLNAEIERLEKQAGRNPADEETRDELARVYVKRAKVEQAGGQLKEALDDYQSALRHDPDNDDAQAGAAAATEAIGGDKEDENGAPAPLPITPNVADEGGKPTTTPTPKKQ